jgi:hypothetical protein
MTRAPRLRRLLIDSSVGIVAIQADGDCFYRVIAKALGEGQTTMSLRDIVAAALTMEELVFYKVLHNVPGYSECAQCTTLEELKSLIATPCRIWADQFAIETLAKHFHIRLFIVDDGAQKDKFVIVNAGGQHSEQHADDAVVLLHRTRRQHYNLITVEGRMKSELQQMKQATLSLFGVSMDSGGGGGGSGNGHSSSNSKGHKRSIDKIMKEDHQPRSKRKKTTKRR